jgi:hypothetical protein
MLYGLRLINDCVSNSERFRWEILQNVLRSMFRVQFALLSLSFVNDRWAVLGIEILSSRLPPILSPFDSIEWLSFDETLVDALIAVGDDGIGRIP